MNEGIEKLREKRERWVTANRENGFDEGIKSLLTQLYPDNAHFIYELLQNAEDPQATVVRFTLRSESVDFEHDGQRLFNLKDVESITSIGASTKRDDPTQIGKFGVGFKAVFAYTNTPEIHSGKYHFQIHDLVVPEGVESHPTDRTTLFRFPFDNQKKPKKQAVKEVQQGLIGLGDNTLLFLRHIRKIEYQLPNGRLGSQECISDEHDDAHLEIHASKPGDDETVSHWLRFQKDVEIKEDGQRKSCQIAIAYRLEPVEDGTKKKPGWTIVPLDHGQVSIFFPAEKETSNLRFHLHAPFASTVARDSVRDCPANDQLRDHLADLVVESLESIRDRGWLTVDFLSVLPIPGDNLPEFYEPIREAIVTAFQEQNLTPTRSGDHAPANTLYRGPARIQEVIGDDDLAFLIQEEAQLWAKNPPPQNQREDRFLESLEIRKWEWSDLHSAFEQPHISSVYWPKRQEENASHKHRLEEWIADKDDSSLMKLYALLGESISKHDGSRDVGQQLRMVRVSAKDERDDHVTAGDAYFTPEGDDTAVPDDVACVKPSTYATGRSKRDQELAKTFLESVGVRPYDERAGVERILKRYKASDHSIRVKDNIQHIRQFIRYWKQTHDASLFKPSRFLAVTVKDSVIKEFRWPTGWCLDTPFVESGLAELSHIHLKSPVWDGYATEFPKKMLPDFIDFLKDIGVMHCLKIERQGTYNNPHRPDLSQDYRRHGTRLTDTSIDEDYSISSIEEYLEAQSIPASRLIWDALIHANRKTATARFRPNRQHQIREADSTLIYHLKEHAWIPDIQGEFRKPQDLARDNLRNDFPYDDQNGLLTAIGFGEEARRHTEAYRESNAQAEKNGFRNAAHMTLAAQATAEMTDDDLQRLARKQKPDDDTFPEKSSPNPERRRRQMVKNRENAPAREKVARERTIEIGLTPIKATAKAYLRSSYTNENGRLICQCCRNPMPFKLPQTDEDYFEAVQFLAGLDKQHYENYLALCPTCSAKYQHACQTGAEEIKRRFLETQPDGKNPVEIEVQLAGSPATLRFVAVHALDLSVVLQ